MKVTLREPGGYLWFEVYERASAEDFRDFYAHVVAHSERTGITRILIDSHEAIAPSVSWIYEAARTLPREPARRFAGLYRDRAVFQSVANFTETATENRGFVVKTFFDPDDAVRWLLGTGSQHDAPPPA